MLAIDREVKEAIESAERKNLILAFDDGTVIDNDDIAIESMELEQSISEEEVLKFGGINSACFKVKIKGSTKEYKNLWFNASLNVGDYTLPLGRFLVNSDIATADRKYRNIVAYDELYTVMNKDVSEWYNGLTFPISIYDMRNSLFDYLGIEQVETELINDDYMVDKTLDGNGISGHKVLIAICELNAVFGVINAYGQFKYVQINNLADTGLFPSEALYPSEDLYPQDIYDDCLSKADYKLGSLTYEEFSTQNITKVVIREEVNDVGVSVGEDGNTYAIEDNFLVYGDTIENLTVVAQNIFDYAKHLNYTPASLKCNGKPWREVGDMIQVFADDRVFHMPIMNRVLKGIQALVDTYSARGRETYEEQQEVGYKAEMRRIKSRTNVLVRNIDETRSEISRVEKDAKKYADEASEKAETNANLSTDEKLKSYSTTTEMKSVIEQQAEEINLEVSRVETKTEVYGKNFLLDTKEDRLVYDRGSTRYELAPERELLNGSRVWISFNIITADDCSFYIEGTSENEYLWQAGYIEIEGQTGVKQRVYTELRSDYVDDFSEIKYLLFTLKDDRVQTIISEVKLEIGDTISPYSPYSNDVITKDSLVSSINLTPETIELKGNRVIVESTKWKVNENGSQECSDLTITGGNIDIYTSSESAIAVEGDIYRSQIGAGGISVFRPDWNRRADHIANGFFVYNNDGTRVTDITGDINGMINTEGSITVGGFLTVSGTKSRIASTNNYGNRLLYCYETPSPMFGDLGEGKIDETGKCYIFLDDIFGETIDTDCVYQVFLQPYGKGDCYVTERTSSYFIVEGTENLSFGWELKAIQRDFDTMRLEEYQEPEQEETDVLSDTYGYLTTLLYKPETEEIENE